MKNKSKIKIVKPKYYLNEEDHFEKIDDNKWKKLLEKESKSAKWKKQKSLKRKRDEIISFFKKNNLIKNVNERNKNADEFLQTLKKGKTVYRKISI